MTMDLLRSLNSLTAVVLKSGNIKTIPIVNIVLGDFVELKTCRRTLGHVRNATD